MARRIEREVTSMTLGPDPSHGMRPQRIQWGDRWGSIHQVEVAAVADRWLEYIWWFDPPHNKRVWRVQLKMGGMMTVSEDLHRRPGEQGYWMVESVED